MAATPQLLLLDANVLIDYQNSDFSILALANKHLGKVQILTTILAEVHGLDAEECERNGLTVIEPELEQVFRAMEQKGRLSFQDQLCLIVAAADGYTCVTNDKALYRACAEKGVTVIRGLAVMIELVRCGAMRTGSAIEVAEKIHAVNPLHIPRSLIDHFRRSVAKASGEGKKG